MFLLIHRMVFIFMIKKKHWNHWNKVGPVQAMGAALKSDFALRRIQAALAVDR